MTKKEKTKMWSRFDKIVCIHYLPYMKERYDNCVKELTRVGILDLPQFEWEFTVPNVFNSLIKFPKGRIGRFFEVAEKQYAIQYYTLMKKLLMLGYEKVLILEDDAFFLKDLDKVKEILDATPADWDIVNYSPLRGKGWLGNGKGFWGHYYDLNGNEVDRNWNDGFFVRYHSVVYGTVCNTYTHRAIERYVENTEKCLLNADGYTWKDTGDLNTYCAAGIHNICVADRTYEDHLTEGTMENTYIRKGFDIGLYNLNNKETKEN